MSNIIDFIDDFLPGFEMPERFFEEHSEKAGGIYFATCSEREFMYVDESFARITGYAAKHLLNGRLRWWFSIVHPEDLEPMLQRIFKLCFLRPENKRLNKPFSLEFRIKKPGGEWTWMRETKCIVGINAEGKNEYIIGILEDITDIKAEEEALLKQFLEQDTAGNAMLRAALPIIDPEIKKRIDPFLAPNQYSLPEGVVKPTDRELEILELIGRGLSTKQIADKLFISINTVETHRRRLLEKMQVKNSMELIKQTRNAFWMKAV